MMANWDCTRSMVAMAAGVAFALVGLAGVLLKGDEAWAGEGLRAQQGEAFGEDAHLAGDFGSVEDGKHTAASAHCDRGVEQEGGGQVGKQGRPGRVV